jgi:hypothetical protein
MNMKVMGFRKFIKSYLSLESFKEIELNRILDKMIKKSSVTNQEKNFLDSYEDTDDEYLKDYLLLSKNNAFNKIKNILDNNKEVICDLYDRDGKIGLKVLDIKNDFESETCIITLKGGLKHILHDRFLYNLLYNGKKGNYSLQSQDEFFEKIPVKSND